ncbi:MAG: transcription repressor NadR [Eubacteriales bacterium]|nr:transcription repressor NadR [Eubacteriales bacterium]
MTGNERRMKILETLSKSSAPIAAKTLAKEFNVSRQIIVSDIALLRAEKHEIASTNRGYILSEDAKATRVFKVKHSDDEVEQEMNLIVDYGGTVEDVFVYHKTYGTVRAEMNIRSRIDVIDFMKAIETGKSSFLKNITDGYHYHTITASSEKILDRIQEQLEKNGFLAQLQDYEPVNFWKEESAK